MRNEKQETTSIPTYLYNLTEETNYEKKLRRNRKLSSVMEIFQNYKDKKEVWNRYGDASGEDVKKSLLDTLYFNGNKTDNNVLVVGTDLIELSYVQKVLNIDVIEHFFKTIGSEKVNFYDDFIKELNEYFQKWYGYQQKPRDRYNIGEFKFVSSLQNHEKMFQDTNLYMKFGKHYESFNNITIDESLKIYNSLMEDVEKIEHEFSKKDIKRILERKFYEFFEREYDFFRTNFFKYDLTGKPNFTNFNFSRDDLEKNHFFKSNPHFKKLTEWFIFKEDTQKPFFKNFKVDNFYSSYNIYLIDNINETELLINAIEEKMKTYKINHLVILDKDRLNKLDMEEILLFAKRNNLNVITENMTINYGIANEESIFLHSIQKKQSLEKNKLVKNFYTLETTQTTYDTIDIRDLQIFNAMKEMFFSNINVVNFENNGTLLYKGFYKNEFNEKITKIYDKITRYPEFWADQQRKEKTIDLKVIDIDIKDKSMIESFKLLNRNFSNREVFFNNAKQIGGETDYDKIDIYKEDLLWFLFGKVQYNTIHEIEEIVYEDIENINKEENINQKELLNIILKYYKNDIPFLLTNEGSKIKSSEEYLQINKKLTKFEVQFNKNIDELTYLSLTNGNFYLANNGEKFNIYDYKNLLPEEHIMFEEISNAAKNFFYDYALKHLGLFNTKNVNNTQLIKNAMQNIVGFIQEATEQYYINYRDGYLKKGFSWETHGYDKKSDLEIFQKLYPNFKLRNDNSSRKNLLITNQIKYFENLQKTIDKTMKETQKWLQVNFELGEMFSVSKMIDDFEKITKGENPYNLSSISLKRLQENVKNILKDPKFLKLKEYSSIKLFSQKEIYEFRHHEKYEPDNSYNRVKHTSNFQNTIIYMDEIKPDKLDIERKKELFSSQTNINEYFSSNMKHNPLAPLKHDIMKTQHISHFYNPIIEKLDNGEKSIYEKINSKTKFIIPQIDNNEKTMLYYYQSIMVDIKEKLSDRSISVWQFDAILEKMIQNFLKYKEYPLELEKEYYCIKGEMSSRINAEYLLFKEDEIELLRLFANSYLPSMNALEPYSRETLKKVTRDIVEFIRENGQNLRVENEIPSINAKELNYYYIVRIFINYAKSLRNDPVLSALHAMGELILIDANLFALAINNLIQNNTKALSNIAKLEEIITSFEETQQDIELVVYKRALEFNIEHIINITQEHMRLFSEENYSYFSEYLKKRAIIQTNRIYDYFCKILENNFIAQTRERRDIKNPLYAIVIPEVSKLMDYNLKEICKKHDVSILIGKMYETNGKTVFKATELINNVKEYNKDGKLEYTLINRDEKFSNLKYSEDAIKINLYTMNKTAPEPQAPRKMQVRDIAPKTLEEKILLRIDLDTDVSNPLFSVILDKANPSFAQEITQICLKYGVSAIITELEEINDKKTLHVVELINNTSDYTQDGKIRYNLIDKYREFDTIVYDESVMEINSLLS